MSDGSESFALHLECDAANDRVSQILDAKYEKANINENVHAYHYLSLKQKKKFKVLLYKYEELFDGTLVVWDTSLVDFELKEGARPFHAWAFPVLHAHEAPMKRKYL